MAPPTRVSLAEQAITIEVEIAEGEVFTVKKLTKELEVAQREAQEAIDVKHAAAADHDDLIEVLGAKLDLMVERNGARKKASRVLKDQWEANRVDVMQVVRLLGRIDELQARPT